MTAYERFIKKKLPKELQERTEGFSSQGHSSNEVIFRAGFYVGKYYEGFRDKLIPGSKPKETEWISIEVEPAKKSCVLYQVAIITTRGNTKVATALCSYEKKRNKFFWAIQHSEYYVSHGTILAYAKLPGFPLQFLEAGEEEHGKTKGYA